MNKSDKLLLLIEKIEENFPTVSEWNNLRLEAGKNPKSGFLSNKINGFFKNFSPGTGYYTHIIKLDELNLSTQDYLLISKLAYKSIKMLGYTQLTHFDESSSCEDFDLFFKNIKQLVKLSIFQ